MDRNYIDDVRCYIVENMYFGDADQLQENTSFTENGILDSTGILELITFMEKTYGIHIDDDELIPENLDSLNNIAGFIGRKIDAAKTHD